MLNSVIGHYICRISDRDQRDYHIIIIGIRHPCDFLLKWLPNVSPGHLCFYSMNVGTPDQTCAHKNAALCGWTASPTALNWFRSQILSPALTYPPSVSSSLWWLLWAVNAKLTEEPERSAEARPHPSLSCGVTRLIRWPQQEGVKPNLLLGLKASLVSVSVLVWADRCCHNFSDQ